MNVKYEYRVEKKVLTAADLNNGFFQQLQNRRKTRPASVRAILERLTEGKHFGTPLHVNRKEGGCYIIDGNHRWEAIKRFLLQDAKNTLEVSLFIYDNLSDEEEKDVFTTINKANKQNTNDVVKQYEDEIVILKFLRHGWQNNGGVATFPVDVSIYPQPNTISFYRLVGAYLACKDQNWHGGYMGTPWDFVEAAQALRLQDVRIMAAFMGEFMRAFGVVIKNNEWLRGTSLTAIMKLWLDNRAHIPPEQMIKLFHTRLYKNAMAADLGKAGGAGATLTAHSIYKSLLNKSQKKFVFR